MAEESSLRWRSAGGEEEGIRRAKYGYSSIKTLLQRSRRGRWPPSAGVGREIMKGGVSVGRGKG